VKNLPRLCRPLAVCFALLCMAATAFASGDWQQPTPEELKMMADPKAPGAAAVYLYREEVTDDKLNMHSLYVRLKVLTDKGKEYGDVHLPPYDGRNFTITNVAGRTIHPNGTVIPLGEKPISELLLKQGADRYKSLSFSLPAVEPGSILDIATSFAMKQIWPCRRAGMCSSRSMCTAPTTTLYPPTSC
jgi:hypothetical protein